MEAKGTVYYGELKCEHGGDGRCSNGAYYSLLIQGNRLQYVCGTHSRKRKGDRHELPKIDPVEKRFKVMQELQVQLNSIEEARLLNVANGKRGNITLFRLKMRKMPGYIVGVLNIFPNHRHGNRKDGEGYPEFSPMVLGELEGGKLGKNIENFQQRMLKCYRREGVPVIQPIVLEDYPGSLIITVVYFEPGPEFWKNREEGRVDPEPQRHKFPQERKSKGKKVEAKEEKKEQETVEGDIIYVWIDLKTGKIYYLTYVHSRQFYCNYYERMVSEQKQFGKMTERILNGTNIRICGYDAEPIVQRHGETLAQAVEREYLNPDTPFGHERVLFAMWMLPSEQWPWRKYKTFEF